MAILATGLLACAAQAQVVPSAIGPGRSLWLGAEYSNINASFPYQSNQRLWGIGGFADYHFTGHIAVEGEARFLRFNSFYGETEDNYLAGPRYMIRTFHKLQPYAQCLVGEGKIQYPFQIGTGSYLTLAPGGGANYRLSRKWIVRGEYEYQMWLNSPGVANEPSHELTPSGFHVGIAYRLLGR
ncbi:MAG: outer membrane beta-barrel protein [Terracidiphilus sp.]|jgi:opacity protein-like surface antigen